MQLKIIQNEVKRTIAVAAGKGGVGKSTLAVLLASSLAKQGEAVGLLDADLYGPSLRQMVSVERLPLEDFGKWIPGQAYGMQVMSYAFFAGDSVMRAPIANQILRQVAQNVFWGNLDWLFIDFPPGTGDIPISVAQHFQLNGAVIVTTPQKVALLDVKKTIDMFRKMDIPILGIVENMSYYGERECAPFGRGGGLQIAQDEDVPFLGELPIVPSISTLADSGKLAAFEAPALTLLAERFKLKAARISNSIRKTSIDQNYLKIAWENGIISRLHAETLQKNCPCAACRGSGKVDKGAIYLHKVEQVGRYGLKFDFSSGCSCGIYPFDLLARLGND